MARAIATDAIITIISALNEMRAGEIRGLSIPELIETTGLTDRRIRTIVTKPEYGFRVAQNTSSTGALTYYHDMTKMDITVQNVESVAVTNLGDAERITQAITGLLNALYFLDPAHKLLKEIAEDYQPEATNPKNNRKAISQRNYFDWMLSEADIDYLAGKAKEDKSWRGKELIAKIEAGVDERLKEYGTPIEANRMMLHDLTNSLRKWTLNSPDGDAVQDSEGAIRNALGILYMALKYNRLVS